jgi:hypothetical protein
MRFLVVRGIACAAGESLTTTETVVSERPRWVARVLNVTFPFLSVVLLLVNGNFQEFLEFVEGVSHLNLALSKANIFGISACGAKGRVPHRKRFLGDESRV